MTTQQETFDNAKIKMQGALDNADVEIAGQLALQKLSPLEVTKRAKFKIMKYYEAAFSKFSLDPKAKTDTEITKLMKVLEIEYKNNLAALEANKNTYLEIVAYLNKMTELQVLIASTKKNINGLDLEDIDSQNLISFLIDSAKNAISDFNSLPLPHKDLDLIITIRNKNLSRAEDDINEMNGIYNKALDLGNTAYDRMHKCDYIIARVFARPNNAEIGGQSTLEKDIVDLREHLALLRKIHSTQNDNKLDSEIALVEKNIQEALAAAMAQLKQRLKEAKTPAEKRMASNILGLASSNSPKYYNQLVPAETESPSPKPNENNLRAAFGDIRKIGEGQSAKFEQYNGMQWMDVTPGGRNGTERDKEMLAYENAAAKTSGREFSPGNDNIDTAVANAEHVQKKTKRA
jgi:hypothetical protein